jgi:hypothetical protein
MHVVAMETVPVVTVATEVETVLAGEITVTKETMKEILEDRNRHVIMAMETVVGGILEVDTLVEILEEDILVEIHHLDIPIRNLIQRNLHGGNLFCGMPLRSLPLLYLT